MTRVAVVADSSACLPAVGGLPLTVVPITIHLETRDLPDGAPSAYRLVYAALARGEAVKSSAPTPLDYLGAVEGAEADAVVVVTPATEFTVMYRNAQVAAELASRPVAVVDSRSAAAAHGLVVLEACQAAASGEGLEQVVRAAEDASRRADLVAAIDSLEFVRRSGHVPSGPLALAQRLGVRPVFRLRQGVVERLGVPRGREAALRRVHREFLAAGGGASKRRAVFHAASPQAAEALRSLVGGVDFVTEFSAAMGIHTGPGVVGVAWLA